MNVPMDIIFTVRKTLHDFNPIAFATQKLDNKTEIKKR